MIDPKAPEATAGIRVPPPLYFGGAIGAGVALEWVRPAAVWPEVLRSAGGIPLIVAGMLLLAAGLREFVRAGARPEPHHPVPAVISTGIYRYTRNQLYLGMALITAGIGLRLDLPWILAALVVALVLLQRFVIEREEAYLAGRFGDAYVRYKSSVRRLI